MTTDGPTPGSGEPTDETRVDWPASPPPPGAPPPGRPAACRAAHATASDPPPRARVRGARAPEPPWAPPPTGAGQYAVPGMPALVFAGAEPPASPTSSTGSCSAILASVLFGSIVAHRART